MVITGNPELAVYWAGELQLEEIPGLISSQTGYVVVRQGKRWMLYDPDGTQVPVRAEGGTTPVSLVDRASASIRTVSDALVASSSNLRVSVVAVDAGMSFSAPKPSLSLDGYVGAMATQVVDGTDFSLEDTETRSYTKYTVVGDSGTRVESGTESKDAGIIFKGSVWSIGVPLRVRGDIEISRFSGVTGLDKSVRKVHLNLVCRRGEWIEVAELDRAEVAANLLKSWGVSASARRLRLYVVVDSK